MDTNTNDDTKVVGAEEATTIAEGTEMPATEPMTETETPTEPAA